MMAIVTPLAQKRKPAGKKDEAGEKKPERKTVKSGKGKEGDKTEGKVPAGTAARPADPTETQEER